MKTKLKIVSLLTVVALAGIIAFQVYWSFNAFKLNKARFDDDIDLVMQRALDSCKKDYFDSLRVVMVKRLSKPEMGIRLDTIDSWDTAHRVVLIHITKNGKALFEPYNSTLPSFDLLPPKNWSPCNIAGVSNRNIVLSAIAIRPDRNVYEHGRHYGQIR